MKEPVRELRLTPSLRLYVSDMASIVIEQSFGDVSHVFFDEDQIDELVSALRALKTSAAAKRAALDLTLNAEYRAAFGDGA